MKRHDLAILFALGLAVNLLAALAMPVPGYMDAEYYYAGGLRLKEGFGFSEPYLWNYLNNPQGLPQPAFTYWMPLASLVAAGGMFLANSVSFLAARSVFIFLAAGVPVITAVVSYQLSRTRWKADLAGMLAIFSGFYSLYLSNTDNFAIVMLLGAIFTLLAFLPAQAWNHTLAILSGLLAGGMHLARADGLLWLAVALTLTGWKMWRGDAKPRNMNRLLLATFLLLLSYFAVMAPWYGRNLTEFGSMMPPGNGRSIWFTQYNQLFTYPADKITASAWLEAGWKYHLLARLNALGMNLKNTLAVQGMIFLLPVMLLGAWRTWHQGGVWFIGSWYIALLIVMTILFPYAGARGGFLHSGAAFQPWLWSLAAEGVEPIANWLRSKRNWKPEQAAPLIAAGTVVIAALVTVFIFWQSVYGSEGGKMVWRLSWDENILAGEGVKEIGALQDSVVMVNNPPGFYLASGLPAVVIPDGDITTLLAAAHKYKARYLVLQKDHVAGLKELYQNPGDRPGLKFMSSRGNLHFYKIDGGE